MFETAIIGALPGKALGIVRQCIECRARLGPDAPPCPGFGTGCFLTPRRTQDSDPLVERSGVV